jgi:hypothetical protein
VPISQAITFEQRAIRDHPATNELIPSPPRCPTWAPVAAGDEVPGSPTLAVTGAGDLVTQSAVTSTPGEAVIRIENILRVNIARLITGSPGKMEV